MGGLENLPRPQVSLLQCLYQIFQAKKDLQFQRVEAAEVNEWHQLRELLPLPQVRLILGN